MNSQSPTHLDSLIAAALREDIGSGDHTSLATLDPAVDGEAFMLVKQAGVMAGLSIAGQVFRQVDAGLNIVFLKPDGSAVGVGDRVMRIAGKQHSILSAERTALNFVQRLSGIASLTARFVEAIEGTGARLLDTRKTTPGWRALEKAAVRLGGGYNHRMGLFDMILIKDNHVDFCGSITSAVGRTRQYMQSRGLQLKIEVETRSLDEVREALAVQVDRIMLDNFPLENLRNAVRMIGHSAETEASGGIRLETIRAVAETGVNYISVGALTHSATALDVSLEAV